MKWYSASDYYKDLFGTKVYKLAVDAGCTCPTRDGSKGTRGCIFCSPSGSGDFCSDRSLSVKDQLESAKILVSKKLKTDKIRNGESHLPPKYIAYFQNFTNTYGDEDDLLEKYRQALKCPDIAGISIATRPDCISDSILAKIAGLKGYVSIELGLQTSCPASAVYIRRGFENEIYADAVRRIKACNPDIHIVTHLIFGLPGETEQDMMNSLDYALRCGTDGIKITVLYVLEGTDAALDYRSGKFTCLEEDEYFSLLEKALLRIPQNIVVHRLTGDGPKKLLIAPLWTTDKKRILNRLKKMREE